jgi:hypothetical protein
MSSASKTRPLGELRGNIGQIKLSLREGGPSGVRALAGDIVRSGHSPRNRDPTHGARGLGAVRTICALEVATGNATFESEPPEWEAWDKSQLPDMHYVPVDGGDGLRRLVPRLGRMLSFGCRRRTVSTWIRGIGAVVLGGFFYLRSLRHRKKPEYGPYRPEPGSR